MTFFSEAAFAAPHFLWAFALFPLLVALFFRNERRRARLLERLVAARLRERLAGSASAGKRRAKFALLLLGAAGALLALARPQWGHTIEERKDRGNDVIVVIDVSRSMLANDVTPSRLARTKLAAEDLLAQLRGDRVGLVAFAGVADLIVPLTTDFTAVAKELRALETRSGDVEGGTNLGAAIRIGAAAFGKVESESRALVIFSDGEELDADGVAAAEESEKIRIFTIGVGSADGTVIAAPRKGGSTEYVKGPQGEIVKSRLDEVRLRAIAEATGGFYLPLSSGPAQMERLVRDGIDTMKEHEFDAQLSRRPIERYQWPLSASIALLVASMVLGERKRMARGAALAALLAMALPAQGKNEGVTAYEREDYQRAQETFARQLQRQPRNEALHFDLGAAAYKLGDWETALAAFSKALTSRDPELRASAEYNLANTLAQRGIAAKEKAAKLQEWRDALAHYDEALKLASGDANAQFNRDAVRGMIAELEKKPPQSEQQEKKDQSQNKPPDSGDEEKQGSESEQKQDSSDPQKEGDSQKEQGAESQKQGGKQPNQKPGNDGKDEESQTGADGKPGSQKEEKSGGKDGKNEPQEGEGKQEQPGDQKDGKGPKSPQPGRKLSGELKGTDAPPQPGEGERQEIAAEEARAAAEGRMTEAQAKQMLESLANDDQRVRLFDPRSRGPRNAGPVRDW